MQRQQDGSVLLSYQEAETVAMVLTLTRELVELPKQVLNDQSSVLESAGRRLLSTLEFLDDLGVSSEELLGTLDDRVRTG